MNRRVLERVLSFFMLKIFSESNIYQYDKEKITTNKIKD
jgi:hypothetical protein